MYEIEFTPEAKDDLKALRNKPLLQALKPNSGMNPQSKHVIGRDYVPMMSQNGNFVLGNIVFFTMSKSIF